MLAIMYRLKNNIKNNEYLVMKIMNSRSSSSAEKREGEDTLV